VKILIAGVDILAVAVLRFGGDPDRPIAILEPSTVDYQITSERRI
jgi:hypothetical protein